MLNQIHVSMAVDGNFERPLAAALASLAAAHEPQECTVTVLHTGLRPSFCGEIDRVLGDRLVVRWLPVPEGLLDGAAHCAFTTAAANFRLLLPALLPPEQPRTLYLDADTMVVGTLRPLWETDLGDRLAGAVRDACSPWAAGPMGPDWRGLGLAPDTLYYNSGVMVLPLNAWREQAVAEQVLTVLREHSPRWGDQDALNLVLRGRWHELPRRWNLQTADLDGRSVAWALWPGQTQAAIDDPAVLHLTENDKPWLPRSSHPASSTWFGFLDQTHLAGWRPGDVHPHRIRRASARVRRAGRVLAHGG